MDKFTYIVRTLSRTRRKDYENYVVNAVCQRLSDPGIKPVTQQYVRRIDGSYYLIDLYFPQFSMGVECDEGYHESREQRDRDAFRHQTRRRPSSYPGSCVFILRSTGEDDAADSARAINRSPKSIRVRINGLS